MNIGKRSFLLGLGLLLAGCAGAGPTESMLDEASRNSVVIQSVSVDGSALGATTEGQQVPSSTAVRILEEEAARLVGQGAGATPTVVVIKLESVNLISAAQSILIGGESVMKGTVSLVNARNGQVIIPPQEIDAGGGGWVLGGIVGAATRDDPATELRQMSAEFVDRTQVLILGM
ncbi:hypothetical protein C7964_10967 [Loktanella sp. PT4BL]|jgi:hypothetical protein|uniref:hypothetical protein n=1 Tax=Loktanella sp. PT4BL TaxID=2135611 RepID=UPI000D7576F5|nr:hypothetical protein [Loktanella sp. PT4BL]PXW66425.1 hypothetical protein C7964_10967 [Loktanella sp. PT4BL]